MQTVFETGFKTRLETGADLQRALEREAILRDLGDAIARLAETVDDEPPIARALRRFADALPTVPPGATRRDDLREVMWSALDEGALDARGFDWLMIAEGRARRRSLPGEPMTPPGATSSISSASPAGPITPRETSASGQLPDPAPSAAPPS